MLNSLASFFNKTSQNEALNPKSNSNAKRHIIYRDGLSKIKPAKKGNISGSLIEISEPLINKDYLAGSENPNCDRSGRKEDERGVVRVKVMMTKQEASRLLSRCADGGALGFKDVARALVNLPADRVAVLSLPISCCGGGTV